MTDTASTRPVQWGILGTAKIATKVARAIFLAEGAQCFAIASRDANRAKSWVEQHTIGHPTAIPAAFLPAGTNIKTCGNYLDMLNDSEIDAVYIPLPPSLHCEWTCRAAEQGKHVLCEKPLAPNLAEAQRMAAACRAANRQLMDGMMWVHHDRTAAMRAIFSSGELGPLKRVTSAFSINAWHLRPDDIRFQRELGGGALGDMGWYCVGAILWAFGDLPQRVFATARFERDVDMNLSATLWFSGDRMASFDCSFDTVWRKWLEIAGTMGAIVCDDFVNPWDAAKARFWVHESQGKSTQHDNSGGIQEVRMIEDFCKIVRSGVIEPAWTDKALAIQRVCDAIARSARSGQTEAC